MDLPELARAERADFADFLETLTPEQWEQPSLCAGWSVHDVVAHVIGYDELGVRGTVELLARARFSLSRANALCVESSRAITPAELIATMRRNPRPRGLPGAFGGRVAFLDGLIHQQDVRRALDLPRDVPKDRVAQALRMALQAPPLGAAKRLRGLRAVATDVDWSAGTGPEVRGPGEAVLLSLAGRRPATKELTGPGVELLAGRMD